MSDERQAAAMWDERFAGSDYCFGTEPAAFLAGHAELLEAGRSALVVADGEGRNSVFLAQRGLSVTSMDISTVGAAKARRLADSRDVTVDIRVADIVSWEWTPEAYDVVVAIFIQFLGPEPRSEVFAGMKRTLRPGGLLLVHGYRPEQLAYGTGGPPVAENLYTEELLRDEFEDFEIVSLRGYDAEIHEGRGHSGMSALIDLVATKPTS